MAAAIIVGIIIAGILVLTAFTSQDEEIDVSPSEDVDIAPPSIEPTQGRQLHLELNESLSMSSKP